ncbi:hypothetical protein [Bacillus sp. ISL-55]|uniref:hypothetical protein n=1 Tax=Bacillus sp. ISL-55 TaxID=2819134 RepID=UPI001BE802D1|nr:hypothetical protein [Bacillus sp. ISL-55]MBT2693536.1 hypothetical protein [Bacillus sp. ISL-55]
MTLSFEQKVAIFEDEQYSLERYSIKPNKVNFKYKGKVIVREMREGSSVAYVWGKDIYQITKEYEVDDRYWIHIHDFREQEIRELLVKVLALRDKIHLKND